MKTLNLFIEKDSAITIKNAVETWNEQALDTNRKYIFTKDGNESTYTVKSLKVNFRSMDCRVLILIDQSSFERLIKMDEKYQKLYLASIVHDIRTPLHGILGMLELMSGRTQEEAQYLSVAKKTCKLMMFLTYDITDYSMLETKKFRVANENTNIKDTVGEVHQLLAFSLEKKRLEYVFRCSEEVPVTIYIDKNRYMQILLNVLSNAIKYTFGGSIKVSVDYESLRDMLVTSVKDTGIGIKQEDIPKLFKLFGKLESNVEHNTQGVGLGLAVSKRLAEAMGGYITVVSQEGLGSTFTFGIKANMNKVEPVNVAEGSVAGSENLLVSEVNVNTQMQKYIMSPTATKKESFIARPIAVFF